MKYKFSFFAIPFFLLFYSCKPGNKNENASSAQDPDSVRIPVTAMAMTRSLGNNILSFSGSTEAKTTVNFGFMVSGKISHVLVDEGSKVSKGQLIADLETTDYTLALDIVNANLQKIQDDYDRLTILQGRGSLPASDYVKATANLDEIKARQKQAIKSLNDSRL
jgi:membrane fusion protein (multidrug efflux system)